MENDTSQFELQDRIELEKDKIFEYLQKENFVEITGHLKNEFSLKVDEQTGKHSLNIPTSTTLSLIEDIMTTMKTKIETTPDALESLILLRQCYIALRNSVAIHKTIQHKIAKNESLLQLTKSLLNILNSKETFQDCLIMLLQFLGNLVVDNSLAQNYVWEQFGKDLIALYRPTPTRIASIVGMILYNIFLSNPHLIPNSKEFFQNVIALSETELDYSQLMLELFLRNDIMLKYYSQLEPKERLIMLQCTYELIPDCLHESVPNEVVQLFVDEFKKKSDCILKTVDSYLNEIEPFEVVRLLDIIASASSNDHYRDLLQNDKSLLINCVFLLKSIHSVGKEGNNCFSTIEKLSELTLNDKKESTIREHPGFGFKAALVRTIGNLCWQNVNNQNLVRELDGIPVLLDCCNIDARNPFIIQCVILAIRSLCEGNQENQNVIASMTKIGVVDSAVLQELGFVLHDDGDSKLCLLPYENK